MCYSLNVCSQSIQWTRNQVKTLVTPGDSGSKYCRQRLLWRYTKHNNPLKTEVSENPKDEVLFKQKFVKFFVFSQKIFLISYYSEDGCEISLGKHVLY